MSADLHPDGLVLLATTARAGYCRYCDEPLPAGRRKCCGAPDCLRIAARTWRRDHALDACRVASRAEDAARKQARRNRTAALRIALLAVEYAKRGGATVAQQVEIARLVMAGAPGVR